MTKGRVSAQHMMKGELQSPPVVKKPAKMAQPEPSGRLAPEYQTDAEFGVLPMHNAFVSECLRVRHAHAEKVSWKPGDTAQVRGKSMHGKTWREIYDRNVAADHTSATAIRVFRKEHAGQPWDQIIRAVAANAYWDGPRLDGLAAALLGNYPEPT